MYAETFEGPWFTTQLLLSTFIGLSSFLIFCYCRRRWPLLFAPRTKLKGFSPHEAHAPHAFFGWILPTLRISEFTVLQIVGLDAAVLLAFFKMSFYLFSLFSVLACIILMPVNWNNNIGIGAGDDEDSDWPSRNFTLGIFNETDTQPPSQGVPGRDWLDLVSDANSYLTVHFLFTVLFTILALVFLYRNYRSFVRQRQLFSLPLVHSIPARTVMITNLPVHLRSERALAEYFEHMNLGVESVTVCREVGSLKTLIDRRTQALLKLEAVWTSYVGNPSEVEEYDPSENVVPSMAMDAGQLEGQNGSGRLVVPHRPRPTLRPGWLSGKVDALEHLETRFKEADEKVKKWRLGGRFRATHVAFVTFEKMSSAQIAVQTAYAPSPWECKTVPAPEPRDIIWANISIFPKYRIAREAIVLGCVALLFLTWIFPITALASLLSYQEIKKVTPWLGRLIDSNSKIQAIIQNSLPSVVMISVNALLPFLLEGLTYAQGYRARSWIEYSLLRKYFLFLLVNVVFIFLLASTYWQLVRDLANSPAKIPEKLAQSLQKGRAKHFFLSYVILQGLGIMPLKLLNLGIIVPRIFQTVFTRTPRDYAELNAPPTINYGVVYPQAILIFVITILYSVVQPLIVIFGAIYFGMAYLVFKYQLLFVFYKPYESQGQAWPITFVRLVWGIVIFQLFMIGILTLNKSIIMPAMLGILVVVTVVWSYQIDKSFKPLSKAVCLSSVFEVERGEETEDVLLMREGHPVSLSQSNLSRRRYAQNDDTLYVAPEDERTDYSQPPMRNWYHGILNTGKRRYGHPAITGILPEPWLPLKKDQTLVNGMRAGGSRAPKDPNEGIVLNLRNRHSLSRGKTRRANQAPQRAPLVDVSEPNDSAEHPQDGAVTDASSSSNPWANIRPRPRTSRAQSALSHRLSFDPASGVIMLPEDGEWLEEEDVSSEEDYGSIQSPAAEGESTSLHNGASPSTPEQSSSSQLLTASPSKRRYGTYFHHPERRRATIPGAFNPHHQD
ncbi:DUF221-domain-containing protein [Coniophora puteana RWD-64-598 SS2]|uniref:DUF221-domain-containing protein n=1 Tax=Coniophora puteana (strain RWD-64-598) TaxID=741705 RepID=A0A5M3MAV0_CONPW|nr:DUF221-domain-containing protein [Coniophora puteana RWD-64-598 SS2]EIW76004.1 DUF221-domain-containing protein [Coniophora puteana RWD-64-598 SS2]